MRYQCEQDAMILDGDLRVMANRSSKRCNFSYEFHRLGKVSEAPFTDQLSSLELPFRAGLQRFFNLDRAQYVVDGMPHP